MEVRTLGSKSYNEMIQYPTFEERFRYLKLGGSVGADTFGFDRYLNQKFYQSAEWKSVRDQVILRDRGCDLGVPGRDIYGRIYIHHINPLTIDDVSNLSPAMLDLNNLVCVSMDTHNAIHYGDEEYLNRNVYVERKPGDTCPWR